MLTAALSAASPAYADVVADWNRAALDAIRANRTSPPQASRALAILHASIYDAINGITRSHERYFVQSDVPASASTEAGTIGNIRASRGYHNAVSRSLVGPFPFDSSRRRFAFVSVNRWRTG
jgi:hypothetical protein